MKQAQLVFLGMASMLLVESSDSKLTKTPADCNGRTGVWIPTSGTGDIACDFNKLGNYVPLNCVVMDGKTPAKAKRDFDAGKKSNPLGIGDYVNCVPDSYCLKVKDKNGQQLLSVCPSDCNKKSSTADSWIATPNNEYGIHCGKNPHPPIIPSYCLFDHRCCDRLELNAGERGKTSGFEGKQQATGDCSVDFKTASVTATFWHTDDSSLDRY